MRQPVRVSIPSSKLLARRVTLGACAEHNVKVVESSFRGRADRTKERPGDSTECGALSFATFTSEQSLLFDVEINLRCGAVFDDLLAVQFHF